MTQIFYHSQVEEMLRSFHPTVGQLLVETVMAHGNGQAPPARVSLEPLNGVAPSTFMVKIPLFRDSVLAALWAKYRDHVAVFLLAQKDADARLTDNEVLDAQNAFYECQVNIDRSLS